MCLFKELGSTVVPDKDLVEITWDISKCYSMDFEDEDKAHFTCSIPNSATIPLTGKKSGQCS